VVNGIGTGGAGARLHWDAATCTSGAGRAADDSWGGAECPRTRRRGQRPAHASLAERYDANLTKTRALTP